jgi:uncharacterized membrane protein YsdA (DUF1294 family)
VRVTVLIIFALLSLLGFTLVYLDKRKAVEHAWRIPEKTFFVLGLIGGAAGILIGMYVFRHKTRKAVFIGVLIFDLIANIIILYLVR